MHAKLRWNHSSCFTTMLFHICASQCLLPAPISTILTTQDKVWPRSFWIEAPSAVIMLVYLEIIISATNHVRAYNKAVVAVKPREVEVEAPVARKLKDLTSSLTSSGWLDASGYV